MSPLTAPRAPAWSGLRPRPAPLEPVDPALGDVLLASLGEPGRLRKRASPHAGLEGYYRFEPRSGGPALFLKVLPRERLHAQTAADRIALWLTGHGVAANPMARPPATLEQAMVLLAHPWIEGRFADPVAPDLQPIGTALGRLHRALSSLPWASRIRDAGAERDHRLERLRRRIVDGELLPAQSAETTRDLLRQTGTAVPATGRQVIHGDLNPGNLLLPADGGSPVFLDFEDCAHNWQAPSMDLAMVLERLVLVAEPDDDRAEALATAFIAAYRAQNAATGATDLGAILRALSARALCLLTLAAHQGHPPAPVEWDKFHFLYAESERRAALLRRIERRLAP